MRLIATAILMTLVALAATGVAEASFTFRDIHQHDQVLSREVGIFRFEHEIITPKTYPAISISGYPSGNVQWEGLGGFNPATDTVTSAVLYLWAKDHQGDRAAEKFKLSLGSRVNRRGGAHRATNHFHAVSANASVLAQIQADGKLSYAVRQRAGSFTLEYSALEVNAVRSTHGNTPQLAAPVLAPEPGSMLIWSAVATFGLAYRSRRRKSA